MAGKLIAHLAAWYIPTGRTDLDGMEGLTVDYGYLLEAQRMHTELERRARGQPLLHNLLWLDQDDTTLIELSLRNKENCPRPCKQTQKGCVAIVIHDEAVQNFLTVWGTEKSLLAAEVINKQDYFDWKIHTPL